MPHQCVKCGKVYDNTAQEILKGCSCGAKLFFFIRKEKLEQAKEMTFKLTDEQKDELEKDVLELIGAEDHSEKPVVLDFESIRILRPGKYELDLVNLFKKEPLVFKLSEGKYVIDLDSAFDRFKKKED